MSSGAVQLAAVGLQDEYLTGNPDVTYFIKRFTRHTKFALEVINVPFDGNDINFGSTCRVNVPRNGQLIRSMYLRLVLPPISNAIPNTIIGCYTDSIGHAIVEYADILVGGQTIERINGEYMHIYSQAFVDDSQETSMTYLVGDTSVNDTATQYRPNQVYGLGPAVPYTSGVAIPEYGWYPRTFMVPLPFYFTRSDALAVPIVALTKQDIRVRIKLREFNQVLAGGSTGLIPNSSSMTWSSPIATPINTDTVTFLPYSTGLVVYNSVPSTTAYFYSGTTFTLFNLPAFCSSFAQNNNNLTVACGPVSSLCFSNGILGPYTTVPPTPGINYNAVASDGIDFLIVGNNSINGYIVYYDGISFSLYTSLTIINFSSVSWSNGLNAYVVSDGTNMYTYTQSSGLTSLGTTGQYSTYSSTFGEIYSSSPVTSSNTVILNTTSVSFDGVNYLTSPNPSAPQAGTTWVTYSNFLKRFYTIQPGTPGNPGTMYVGTPVPGTGTSVINKPLGVLQASLAVEYVFLGDDEINYIKDAKIDYVVTQLQRFEIVVPPNISVINGAKLNFINPVKEMFFLIQDSNVLATNDYFNFYNTETGTDQLVNLDFQLNGEDIISDSVASALYMRQVQFFRNHTRLPNPNMAIYNYSWSLDPENYLPTGQVNMSRVNNQNIWMNLTPSTQQRSVRIYAKSYNILRFQYGLGGVLFMDNNLY
jgi:hypothetical protein